MIFFFLVVLSFSNSEANTPISNESFSVEEVNSFDEAAILHQSFLELASLGSHFGSDLPTFKIPQCNISSWVSNNISKQSYNRVDLLFINLKPKILESCTIHKQDYCNEEPPSIS